ncbi:MFS transporter [Kribbella italica]|uniref:MFS transporter n=1 Tax=Kribbella italica TaxID=1540520 RepID=UPI00161D2A71|nr:MFS transporter [Kribbella italica]
MSGNKVIGQAVVCVAQFVVVLDATIVVTALPVIGAELGFSPVQLPAVLTAYTVMLVGLLVLGGRLADLAGARRMFVVGLVIFAGASLVCAVAWDPVVLIVARALQGVGAALLSPAALAALGELDAGDRAIGWWTAAAAGGGASGWVLGGLITELAGWRWVFAVNLPIAVAALVLSQVLRRSPARWSERRRSLDLAGAASITLGIGLFVLATSLIASDAGQWTGWVLLALTSGVVGWFVRIERRADDPLIPGQLLRTPGVATGNLAAAALTGSTTPAMLTVVLYVQTTLHLSPSRGAALFPIFNLAVIAGSLLAPGILRRTGIRPAMAGGFAGVLFGTAVLAVLPQDGLRALALLSAFAMMGFGLGVASVCSTTSGTADVSPGDRGVAAGLLNSTAQLGTAVGLAIAGPLVASNAPMTGYRLGYLTAALIAAAGIVVCTRLWSWE